LGAMALTSLVVFRASQEVALLLLDTGLLFEEFFEQVADLVQPAFAFLTFYSVLVIVFGALYTVIDRVSTQPHFVIAGAGGRDITFPEALHFSLVTLATVGYGDIVPGSNLIRVLSSVEVVAGILLLLFGFNAILTYATQRRPPGRR
ncbi:MAG: potassium channel family protein, partial [Acetobacteraceae bacterium]